MCYEQWSVLYHIIPKSVFGLFKDFLVCLECWGFLFVYLLELGFGVFFNYFFRQKESQVTFATVCLENITYFEIGCKRNYHNLDET